MLRKTRASPKSAASLETASQMEIDYKQVIIKSAEPGQAPYNFYKAVVGASETQWFGYRSLVVGNFGPFFGGGSNQIMKSFDTLDGVEIQHEINGWEPVSTYFKPDRLLAYFGYTFPKIEYTMKMPPCYTTVPFHMRDGEDDIVVRNPMQDMLTETDPSDKGSNKSSSPRHNENYSLNPSPTKGPPLRRGLSARNDEDEEEEDEEENERPTKKQRKMRSIFVNEEADADDSDDEDEGEVQNSNS